MTWWATGVAVVFTIIVVCLVTVGLWVVTTNQHRQDQCESRGLVAVRATGGGYICAEEAP